MKKYLSYIVLLGVLLTACNKGEKEVKEEVTEIATAFLRDYYYKSFEYAKQYGDDKTKSLLDYINKNDRLNYRNQYFDKIDSVALKGEDSALVYYQYENSYYKKDRHVLPLNKNTGQWRVSIENKDNSDFYRYVFDYSIEELRVKNYQDLSNEEIVEIQLITKTFIDQVNHPKLVVGYLGKNSVKYYDIPDVENYTISGIGKMWEDLSSFDVYSSLDFEYDEMLSMLNYRISEIASDNSFGVADEIEAILIEAFGEPYNNQYMEEGKWYKSTRWFVKGKNEMIELINNDNGTLNLSLTESEDEIDNY
ncbi:MAG: hypothetical protein N4A35_01255 [Flavobacteriales bacterium]|jgi:hypothetical protein|nr:hypothetical protein [Flavobacteriales bacterium]